MRVVHPLGAQQLLEVHNRLGGVGRQLGGGCVEGEEAQCPVPRLVHLAPWALLQEVGADCHQLLAGRDLGSSRQVGKASQGGRSRQKGSQGGAVGR